MAVFFYNIFLLLYFFIAKLIAPFNEKSKLWIEGRKNIFERLNKVFKENNEQIIWVHCSSLGEFEQAIPLLEMFKKNYPSYKILLTFFSPSGYEAKKNSALADHIFYLPFDSKKNAETFLNTIKPSLVCFIKYEFWYYYLIEIKQRNIPLLLISANFRKEQPFFKWYGSFHKKMLHCFSYLFVQNNLSFNLLNSIHFHNTLISGDTRFDRVSEIEEKFEPIDLIEKFCKNFPVIVAGSTWLEDDEELDHFANTHAEIRFIIVPHDVQKERIDECKKLYKNSILFSEYAETLHYNQTINTLIIDNVGMLSRLYFYATICYVGGAFGGDGVHNILEAAVYGKPVVFGPEYEKYIEATELIDAGGAFTIDGALELEATFNDFFNDKILYEKAANASLNYVKNNTGATKKIMQYIQEKRLLTN